LECSTLTVPLDHAAPAGETIDIAVARTATADDDTRIGSLVFNPGGPGGSGIEFLTTAASLVPPALTDRFDLVSFDPRGVGASAPPSTARSTSTTRSRCWLPATTPAGRRWSPTPWAVPTPAHPNRWHWSPTSAPTTRPATSTLLRAALGDDQLSYVGFSYGTRLGATYAELFPDRVRALVLDGAVKPTDDLALLGLEQGPGFDAALESFAAACDADADCAVGELGPTLDVYAGLLAEIAGSGLPDRRRRSRPHPRRAAARRHRRALQHAAVAGAGRRPVRWPTRSRTVPCCRCSPTSTSGANPTARTTTASSPGSRSTAPTIRADRPPTRSARRRSCPRRRRSTSPTSCERAPDASGADADRPDRHRTRRRRGADPRHRDHRRPGDPVRVVGRVGRDLLSSGVLYTVEADGHTAFLSVPCVDDVVIDYLVDLELPTPARRVQRRVHRRVPAGGEGEFEQVIALFDCLRDNGVDLPEITVGDLLADPSGEDAPRAARSDRPGVRSGGARLSGPDPGF
jgi:pimeloyl-ACP methyl ester carboxylesterase